MSSCIERSAQGLHVRFGVGRLVCERLVRQSCKETANTNGGDASSHLLHSPTQSMVRLWADLQPLTHRAM